MRLRIHPLGRALGVLLSLLACLLDPRVQAQAASPRPLSLQSISAETLAQRQAAIQKNIRFLGWKFARQSHQDTSKWVRPTPRSSQLQPDERTHRNFAATPTATSPGFGNAGFLARSSLPAGFIPTAITSGDFNEDGKMDFAISNGGDNTIYVFLGNGDGTFKIPEILYTRGQAPDWITSVRLRMNGHLDLAVTNGDSNTVEVFPGNGDGTFQASTQVSVPQIPTFILAADANNDGKQDLVVGLTIPPDTTLPQFEILLGDGSGGFSGTLFPPALRGNPDVPYTTGWIAAGDLNRDGYIDFVTTVTGAFSIPYLNQSGTSFSSLGLMGFNDGPMVIGLGDMDEDGCLDAVQFGTAGLVTVAKGTCDGYFDPSPNPISLVGDLDPAIAIADVDGDGHLDVIGSAVFYPLSYNPAVGTVAGYFVSVLKGDGTGNLSRGITYRGGTDAYSLIVSDFTGDDRPEILTAASLENQVSLFRNDGTGAYGDPQGATIGYTNGVTNLPANESMQVADFNGDGKPDLYVVEYGLHSGDWPELTVLLNDGTGNFLPPVRSTVSVGDTLPVPILTAGPFRNTGHADVIYINTYNSVNSVFSVAFLAGNGDGSFTPPVVLATLPNPHNIVAGDFNHDGKLDFAVLGTDSSGTYWEIDVFLGHGDGTFTHLTPQLFYTQHSDYSRQLLAVDLNRDGNLDLLFGNQDNGDLIELLGKGDGTFSKTFTVLFHKFGLVAVADVNGDGYPDLIQNSDPAFNTVFSNQPAVTVYLGTTSGVFVQQPSYDLPGVKYESPDPPIVGDFNGDGIPDIAVPYFVAQPPMSVVGSIEPRVVILQGVGDGTFVVTGHSYQLQALSDPVVGADFNGDGATDLMELIGSTSSYSTIPAAPAPALDIALDSWPILGTTGKATITLDLPAAVAEDVTLSASDPAIQLPASAHFNVGQQTQDVAFTLSSGFDATHVFALYATLGAQTAVVFGTKPNPSLTVGMHLTPQTTNVNLEPGEDFVIHYTIGSEGGYSGTYAFQCAGLPAGASCSFTPSSATILPGLGERVAVAVSTSSSTPFGTYPIAVSATDGYAPTTATLQIGIGDFSVSIDPTTIVVGPSGNAVATLTSSATNGLSEPLSVSCTGLPGSSQCGADGNLYTEGSYSFGINHNQLATNDYPFQITGTADIVSHTINAVLRVGDFTASLDKTSSYVVHGEIGDV